MAKMSKADAALDSGKHGDFTGAHVPAKEPVALSLRDSIAAHQAECSCHVGDTGHACCGASPPVSARDAGGGVWHVDPLCKVRPEAKA